MPDVPQILHIDDHRLFREGLACLIKEGWPEALIRGTSTYHEGLELSCSQDWSLIVLDIHLGDRTGIDLLKEFRSQKKRVPVLILTMLPESHLASRVFRLGASGFVRKDASREVFLSAITRLLAGKRFITLDVAQQLTSQMSDESKQMAHESLSDREFMVMQNLAAGKTVKDISSSMGLSIKTISTYRSRLLQKMLLSNNSDLMRYCMDNGLLAGSDLQASV